jgi:hypothetical protein
VTFISNAKHWNGATGGYSDYKPEYTAVWRLVTNDANDQSQKAIAYVESAIAALGTPYEYANDSYSQAFLKRIDVNRELGTTDVWIASLHYGVPDDDESNLDNNGNPTDNPLDFRPEMHLSTVQYSRPMDRAYYLGGYTGKSHDSMPKDKLTPVVNSAFVPFDPPAEADHSRRVIQITRNLAWLDADVIKNNLINNAACRFSWRNLSQSAGKYQAKTRDLSVSMRTTNGIDHLEVSVYVDIYEDRDEDWTFRIPDRGFDARAWEGDPDGKGGTYDPNEQRPGGNPYTRRLVDQDGTPYSIPPLFDGDGQPAIPFTSAGGDVFIRDPAIGRWGYYETADFSTLPIFAGIVT